MASWEKMEKQPLYKYDGFNGTIIYIEESCSVAMSDYRKALVLNPLVIVVIRESVTSFSPAIAVITTHIYI